MGIIDNEVFLPGVITEVESDYSYGYDSSQFGTTDPVVLIGTSFNGPVGLAVPIYNPEHGRYVFGKSFDSKTRQEATLVAAIEDAYQRGNRTIYAVRISGKQVAKDFDLAIDSGLKLRVSGTYPSNQVKDYYMVYDNKEGDERIKIYKPAEKATIVEKMQGLVEHDNAVIVTDIRINQDYGLTKDSTLVDLINTVNGHSYNNVLQLSIVNENGVVVTGSSIEAQSLPIGVLHPGAYFVGRDKSLVASSTKIDYKIILENDKKPFASFEGVVFKELVLNTDVSASLPVYAKNNATLRDILRKVELFTSKPFDFLEVKGLVDRAFKKDSFDYEEVNLSKFEIYKRLGSGYATTAKAELRVDANGNELTPRIKETPVGDENRIATISDGIYSMLENMNTKYRVLTCGYADDKVTGRLPRPADFLIANPNPVSLLGDLINATPKVKAEEKIESKSYRFNIESVLPGAIASVDIKDVYTDKILRVVPNAAGVELSKVKVTEGTQILEVDQVTGLGTLKVYNNGEFVVYNDVSLLEELLLVEGAIYKGIAGVDGVVFTTSTTGYDGAAVKFEGKDYVLAENNERVFVFQVLSEFETANAKPLGDVETIFSDKEELTVVYSQSNFFEDNDIIIRSEVLDSVTLEELVELLNAHESLSHLFTFEVSENGLSQKDDYVASIASGEFGKVVALPSDRGTAYDYNKYIPYKTSDNFARQLAQHCTYTGLKTAPTHGIIGVQPLVDLSLNSIAARVEELLTLEYELYAKNPFGRNMLDRNNMPYPIGKNVSIPVAQYPVFMDDGYRYNSNFSAGYAGMVSQLPLDQSSTNQPIALSQTSYDLTNYQLTRLTQKGYVTVKPSYTKGLVVTDGVTMASKTSPFHRLSATRVIGAIEELIREAAEPFIGKQNHAANRNSLQTAIKSKLDKVKGTLIEAYEFNMVLDPKIMKFAYIDIDYKIVPIYEIREVRNRITVKDEL